MIFNGLNQNYNLLPLSSNKRFGRGFNIFNIPLGAFNLFNRPQLGKPDSNGHRWNKGGDASFGRITSMVAHPRIL